MARVQYIYSIAGESSFPFIHFFVSFSSDLLVLLCSFVILINLNFLLLDDWPQSVSKSVNSTLMYLHTVQSRTVDRSFAYNLQHKAKLSVELWTIDRATIITRTKILWEMYNINALTCFTHYSLFVFQLQLSACQTKSEEEIHCGRMRLY